MVGLPPYVFIHIHIRLTVRSKQCIMCERDTHCFPLVLGPCPKSSRYHLDLWVTTFVLLSSYDVLELQLVTLSIQADIKTFCMF